MIRACLVLAVAFSLASAQYGPIKSKGPKRTTTPFPPSDADYSAESNELDSGALAGAYPGQNGPSGPGAVASPDNPWLSGVIGSNPAPAPGQNRPYQPSGQAPGPYQPSGPAPGPYQPSPTTQCNSPGYVCAPRSQCQGGVTSSPGTGSTQCDASQVCCQQAPQQPSYQPQPQPQQPYRQPQQPYRPPQQAQQPQPYQPQPQNNYQPQPYQSQQSPIGGSIYDSQRPQQQPRPNFNNYVTEQPIQRYTGPLNVTPHPGCPAALKCVEETFCTWDGIMTDAPQAIPRSQIEEKVPLSDCQNVETGIIGKCCRDPNYKDPWPAGMMMNSGPSGGGFDDGLYHPPGAAGQHPQPQPGFGGQQPSFNSPQPQFQQPAPYSPNNFGQPSSPNGSPFGSASQPARPKGTARESCGPTANCTPQNLCPGDRVAQPGKVCRVPNDDSTGVCCSKIQFPQNTNNQQYRPPANRPQTNAYGAPQPKQTYNQPNTFNQPQKPYNQPTSQPQPKPYQPNPYNQPKPQPNLYNQQPSYNQPQSTPFNQPKPNPYNQPSQNTYNQPKPYNQPSPNTYNQPQPSYNRPQPNPYNQPSQNNQPQPNPYNQPQPDPYNQQQPNPYNQPQPKPCDQPAPQQPIAHKPTPQNNPYYNSKPSPKISPPSYNQVTPDVKSKPEEPKPEEPKPEEPKPEEPKPEEPKPEEPKPEEPKPEEPKPEEPKPEEPKPEEPKPEEPKPDEPKPEDAKPEEPEDAVEVKASPAKKRPVPGYPSPSKPDSANDVNPEPDTPATTAPPPVQRKEPEPEPGKECGVRRNVPRPNGPAGLETGFGEFPWQAQVTRPDGGPVCSGAILAENIVVTAAHCVDGKDPSSLRVKAGDWKLGSENPDEEPKPTQNVGVAAVAVHPKFEPISLQNDMAVLILDQSLNFDQHVDKLCVGKETAPGQPPSGENCVVSGWGKDATRGNIPGSTMHSIPVSFMANQQCQDAFKKTQLGKYFQLHQSFTCALPNSPNHDLCQVDAGSPIACQKPDGKYELSGIYSWDVGCHPNTNVPVAMSKVDEEFINSVMEKPVEELIKEAAGEKERLSALGQAPENVQAVKPGFSQGYGR